MFREDYHRSFDNISPSAELLDRISAMMSEEAAKKRPPIRMTAVKYGGIAAALAIAAGGTFAVTQMNSGDIKTADSSANYMVGEAVAEAAPDIGASGDTNVAAAEIYEDTVDADGAAEIDESFAAEPSEQKNVVYENAAAPETTPAVTTAAEEDSFSDVPAATTVTTSQAAEVTTQNLYIAANDIPDNENDECESADEDSFFVDAADQMYKNADNDGDAEDINPGMGNSAAVAGKSEDAATGIVGTDALLDPFVYSFGQIPEELKKLADGCVNSDGSFGAAWMDYVYGVTGLNAPDSDEDAVPEAGTPSVEAAGIDNNINVYTFIKYFNIPADKAEKALKEVGKLTEEQINVLLSGDKNAVTAAFASPESLVKGDKVYTPLWLLKHPLDDYTTAGITKEDILTKYDLLTTMSDRYSDAVIDKDTQKALTEKLDNFLKH